MRHGWLWDTQEEWPWTQRAGCCQPAQPSKLGSLEAFIMIPNANLTFLTSDFYCFWQKQPWTTQWGRAGLEANSLSCGKENLNSEFIKLTAPRHSELPWASTQSRNSPPAPAERPAPACQQLLTLSPNRGAFLSFFSWYFVVWMLIPLTKLSPMLFPFSFPLISFSQWKKEKKRVREKKKKKIPASLVWPHLDLHWFLPCHSCYQQELAYGFKGKLRRRKERCHFDGNKGQRNNLPSTKKLICVRFPKQSFEKPMLILGYTKKP